MSFLSKPPFLATLYIRNAQLLKMASEAKFRAMQWTMVGVAPLSVMASTAILVCIFRHRKERRNTVFNRIMIGLSFHDLVSSFALSFGPIPMPRQYGIPNSFGTIATCTAQGFLISLVNAAHVYAVSLSIYYLLVIRYNMREERIAKYVEPVFHLLAIGWGYGCTLYSLVIEIFNPAPTLAVCTLGVAPPGCDYIPGMECTRGDATGNYVLSLYIIPNMTFFGSLILILSAVIFTIRAQIRKNLLYTFQADSGTASASRMFSAAGNRDSASRFLSRSDFSEALEQKSGFFNSSSHTRQDLVHSRGEATESQNMIDSTVTSKTITFENHCKFAAQVELAKTQLGKEC
jgi:hypothetical protein